MRAGTTRPLPAALDAPFWVLAPVVLVSGAVEGAVLGLAQAFAGRRCPTSPRASGFRATIAGAFRGIVDRAAAARLELDRMLTAVIVGAGVPLAATLVLSIGVVQWRVLRSHVPRAGW